MALTKRGNIIYDYFKNNPTLHPTAEEVYAYVKTIDPKVGIATIYRNLRSLVALHHIREINLEKQGVRYDLLDSEHYHFVCDECGKIENFELEELNNINSTIEELTSGVVTGKDLMFHGICKSCILSKQKGR